jgi:uncharacterized protein YjbJ (UPF0337 family)
MAGRLEKTKGKIKIALGSVTGKKNLETEGRLDRRTGQTKEQIGHVKDKVDAATESAHDKAIKATDAAREAARRNSAPKEKETS